MALFVDDELNQPPMYLRMADTHNEVNGNLSIFREPTAKKEEESFFLHPLDTLGSIATFSALALVRGATSTYNLLPAAGNMLGGDYKYAEMDDVLTNFDSNFQQYYEAHKQGIDIAGDVAASFVPGIGAVKFLNKAQRALKAVTEGKAGLGIANGLGALPELSDAFARKAAAKVGDNIYKQLNKDTVLAVASGYGQAALEGAAFTAAASVAMKDYSPMFDEMTAKDIVSLSLTGGGVIGFGIMGTAVAAQTITKLNRAVKEVSVAAKPYTTITAIPEGAPEFTKLMAAFGDKERLLADKNIPPEFVSHADQKMKRLDVIIRDSINNLSSDKDVGNKVASTLLGVDSLTARNGLFGVKKITSIREPAELSKEISIAGEVNFVKYMSLEGDDIGRTYHELPKTAGLGESLPPFQLETAINNYEFKLDKLWHFYTVPEKSGKFSNTQEIEARYLWMSKQRPFKDTEEVIKTSAYDFPLLEKVLHENKTAEILLPNSKEGMHFSGKELESYIVQSKLGKMRDMIASENIKYTTLDISRAFGARLSTIEAEVDEVTLAADLMLNKGKTFEELTAPKFAKLNYSIPEEIVAQGNLVEHDVLAAQLWKMQEQAHDMAFAEVLGEDAVLFSRTKTEDVLKANPLGAGAGLFTAASGDYGTLASITENTGKNLTNIISRKSKAIEEEFAPATHPLLGETANAKAAQEEILAAFQLARETGESYVFTGEALVKRSLLDKMEGLATGGLRGKLLTEADSATVDSLEITTNEAREFLRTWINVHNRDIGKRNALNAATGNAVKDYTDNFYAPAPNPDKTPFFALVQDTRLTAGGNMKAIWARSQQELDDYVKLVPKDTHNVFYKEDTEIYFKAKREFDYQQALNERYSDPSLFRKGTSANFFPQQDIKVLLDELIDYRKHVTTTLMRDSVAMLNSKAIGELKYLGENYTKQATSKIGSAQSLARHAEESVDNPYMDYVKTMLGIPRTTKVPIMSEVNRLASKTTTAIVNQFHQLWSNKKITTEEKLLESARLGESAGVSGSYKIAAQKVYDSYYVDKNALNTFVHKTSGIAHFLMLGSDPMHAVNNGLGHFVLLGAETQRLLRGIKEGNPEIAGKLAQLAEVKIPGTTISQLSVSKLIAGAYRDFIKLLQDDPYQVSRSAHYQKQGWEMNWVNELKNVLDPISLTGKESASEFSKLATKSAQALERFSGNNFVERMNRFVAANIGDKLTSFAIEAKQMLPEEAAAYINTFVSRTQGNYVASQRPLMFQGPVGKAIGLWQTYQMNMLQHIFRRLGDTNKVDIAVLMGLQGGMYGMAGLPAFNAINQYIVGNASGNKRHEDVVSTVFDAAGHEGGQWLTYGLASNMLLGQDFKVNLYTRGDINPRNATIIPTSFADIPLVGMASNVFKAFTGTVSSVAGGKDVLNSLLEGIEKAQVSRPLTGMALTLQGALSGTGKVTPTSAKGNILFQNDLYSVATLARVLGARPLDEAIARDAWFRVQAYEGAHHKEISKIGETIRDKVQNNVEITDEDMKSFFDKYTHAGGNQKNFLKFWHGQVTKANKNQINMMIEKSTTPYSQYMQKILQGSQYYDQEEK